MILPATLVRIAVLASVAAAVPATEATFPLIPEERVPISEVRVSETAYGAVRKPPGDGPFPAILFLHGGLGQTPMANLRTNAVRQPAQARFLAWGYVTVTATRRAIRHDPQDRGAVADTLQLVRAVRDLKHVNAESVALYGGSGGGTLAFEVASVTDELAAIVAGEPATIIFMEMFTREHIVFDESGKPTGDRRWDVMNADPRAQYTPGIRERTRSKLAAFSTPALILHGDIHPLAKFNLGVFIPELEALGKPVTVKTYSGEPHGFYWGRGRDPARALQSNMDADAFLRQHLRAPPRPIDTAWANAVAVEPMRPANRD